MSATEPATRADPTATPRFAEHEMVRLLRDQKCPEGLFPAGTAGVVVGIWSSGRTYLVEVFEPVHDVISVEDVDLVA